MTPAALRGTTLIRLDDDDRDVALPGTTFDAGRRPGATTSPPGAAPGGGDLILTANDRRLRVGSMWVRNRQAWAVDQVRDDGSLDVRLATGRARVTLLRRLRRRACRLGLRTTDAQVQAYFDSQRLAPLSSPVAHWLHWLSTPRTLTDPDAMSRQGLYVGATRDREVN